MNLIAWFDSGDPESRVSVFMSDVEAVEHFKDGRVRVKEYEKVTDLNHVRRFEIVTSDGKVLYLSVPSNPIPVKTTASDDTPTYGSASCVQHAKFRTEALARSAEPRGAGH